MNDDRFKKSGDIFIPGHLVPTKRDLLPTEQFKYTGDKETSDYTLYAQPYMVEIPAVVQGPGGEIIQTPRQYYLRAPAPNLAVATAGMTWQVWEKRGREWPKLAGKCTGYRLKEEDFIRQFAECRRLHQAKGWPMWFKFCEGSERNPMIFTVITDSQKPYGDAVCPEMYITLPDTTVEAGPTSHIQ